MGRRRQRAELVLRMNGDLVGRLRSEPGGRLHFAYDASWLDSSRGTPISHSLPLSTEPYSGSVVAAFFDNLLPDADEIRRRMQATLGAASAGTFDLLAEAGRDCVGAIQLLPDERPVDVRTIDAVEIDEHAIAELLRNLPSAPLGLRAGEDFRMSIAGAHEKTALLRREGVWLRPRGATPTSHVLKPAIGAVRGGPDLSDSVETEWLSMRVARALGLPVAEVEIRDFEDQRALVVERFDRRWAKDGSWLIRLPQEDLCQALGVPPGLKYEADGGPGTVEIMRLLLASEQPSVDRAAFLRATVVSWLLAAIDAHAKNYSIHLLPGGALRLAPLYDIISAYPALHRGELRAKKLKMAMAAVGKNRHYHWSEIQQRHWVATAEACAFPPREVQAILESLAVRLDPAIAEVERELPDGFPASVADPLLEGLRAMRPRLG